MSGKLGKGSRIRVKDGVTAPDLPEFAISGWTGIVAEVSGRGGKKKFFVEWDSDTVGSMPSEYVDECEKKQLYHMMACLTEPALEVVE